MTAHGPPGVRSRRSVLLGASSIAAAALAGCIGGDDAEDERDDDGDPDDDDPGADEPDGDDAGDSGTGGGDSEGDGDGSDNGDDDSDDGDDQDGDDGDDQDGDDGDDQDGDDGDGGDDGSDDEDDPDDGDADEDDEDQPPEATFALDEFEGLGTQLRIVDGDAITEDNTRHLELEVDDEVIEVVAPPLEPGGDGVLLDGRYFGEGDEVVITWVSPDGDERETIDAILVEE